MGREVRGVDSDNSYLLNMLTLVMSLVSDGGSGMGPSAHQPELRCVRWRIPIPGATEVSQSFDWTELRGE